MPGPEDRLDSLAFSLGRYRETKPRLAFRPGDVAAWRDEARRRLIELIGPMPTGRVPLEARYGATVKRPGHSRIPVTFATRSDMDSFGYLLIPDGLKGRVPAVVCIPGHGRGVDDLVGIAEDGTDRDHHDGYQHDFAVQCAEKGYVALAIEPIGFGHRRDEASRKRGSGQSSCMPAAGAALMLGETILGWRVWDALRAIDLLETRAEVDPKRVAMMGISGGGTVTLYAAAIDDRIKASVLSCSFCTFKDSIYSIAHCIDNYVPGILREFEVADIAALIAPRFLFCENGLEDTIFPEVGVRAGFEATERAFAAQGARDHLDSAFFPAGHVFHGEAAFRRLRDWL